MQKFQILLSSRAKYLNFSYFYVLPGQNFLDFTYYPGEGGTSSILGLRLELPPHLGHV